MICACTFKLFSYFDAMFVLGQIMYASVCPTGGKGRPGCQFVLCFKVTTRAHDLTSVNGTYSK